MQYTSRYHKARRVTVIGLLVNLLLGLLKIIFGVIGYSQALIVDGIHSLSDLLTDLLVLMAAKASSRQPDDKHPYGHGRIETFFTIILACLLIVVGLGIVYDVVYHLVVHVRVLHPTGSTLLIALLSVLANEWIFRMTLRVGYAINSNLLVANAWHHRSDAWSSIIVLIGIAGAIIGIPYLDAIAAIIVALLICKMGVKMIWSSVRELIDTAVDDDFLKKIKQEIMQIPGVISIHQLRTRFVGGLIFVDVHVQVDPMISVSEGHFIGEQVPKRLREKFPKISDVMVHVDIGEDESFILNANLPDRHQLQTMLTACCSSLVGYDAIQKIILHYTGDKIGIDLYFPYSILSQIENPKQLIEQYQEAMKKEAVIDCVEIYFIVEGCR